MLDLIYDRTAGDVTAGDTEWFPTWESGNIDTNGRNTSASNRCRTVEFKKFGSLGGLLTVFVPSGFRMTGRMYTGDTADTYDGKFPPGSSWIRGTYYVQMPPNERYRFVLQKEDATAFSPSEAAAAGVKFLAINVKGRYNNTDLNRVETAVGQLVAMLNAAGWNMSLITKTDWQAASAAALAQDVPSAADMARYLGNIATIRHALAFYRTTPPVPDSMELLTWQKANAIERILADAEELINNMLAARFYSGEVYAGEV